MKPAQRKRLIEAIQDRYEYWYHELVGITTSVHNEHGERIWSVWHPDEYRTQDRMLGYMKHLNRLEKLLIKLGERETLTTWFIE